MLGVVQLKVMKTTRSYILYLLLSLIESFDDVHPDPVGAGEGGRGDGGMSIEAVKPDSVLGR